ncbi:hypothetical protein NFHSH190041_30620 [Shewanella sp. NFH-SH190041]|uniref:BufA2 family periplasmic bufferin-type metallophore n=1 Tax=Shewanella sp. NFH-SH190041 TaxID=2950245 RepID=UPI0021C4B871|nr:hypothetical protein [Shewanella sp. NFH-SH190041]BDM65610.1 hypothetical protein NFHSH190041_30620 [Shewanella sp. NFH-SH190041]
MKKTQTALSGAALALAMAGMSGCQSTQDAPTASSAGRADLVHCYGVNVCKGHNDCKGANNACGGHGSCKGTGFVAMPSKACGDIGGKVKDDWVGQISQSELVHCYGINVCKGHNDCKSANNACAGHGSCKGHGFVAVPAKACSDAGGKVGS